MLETSCLKNEIEYFKRNGYKMIIKSVQLILKQAVHYKQYSKNQVTKELIL